MAYLLALKVVGVRIMKYFICLTVIFLITACSKVEQNESITYNTQGWSSQKTPTGFGLVCTECENQVMISIDIVPVDRSDKYTKSNSDFINYLMSEKDTVSQKMASDIMPSAKIEMLKSGKAKISDKDVFRYTFIIDDGLKSSFDNSSLLIHNNNLIKITLNYHDGYFSEKDKKIVDSFYKSIKFN
ncbi:hypothetical protein HX005_06745 [Acinetobacter sp. R933-2]|uniref:hypothetical protein n=1 Tax=Acinetobacter sp. R933-2 TaxID=2746728 RepID=UPI002575C646|nr:hypothetical protein [Acinetobacter sp. R933-2]MDM1247080.1 hypothetical protein [Acinetobacter sp. R933-2]